MTQIDSLNRSRLIATVMGLKRSAASDSHPEWGPSVCAEAQNLQAVCKQLAAWHLPLFTSLHLDVQLLLGHSQDLWCDIKKQKKNLQPTLCQGMMNKI